MGFDLSHWFKLLDRTLCGILAGLALLNLTTGVQWYYGNLSTYTDSYFVDKVGFENHPTGSMWLISLYTSFCFIGVLLCGYVEKRIGLRATLIGSCIGFNLAIFAVFPAVQVSFWAMNIVLGMLAGLVFGFIEGLTVLYAALWFPDNVGVATSVASSAFGGGSLFLNPIITFFINPRNEEPDLQGGTSVFFSDPDIISKVPYVFLVLGGVSTVTQFAAIIFLKTPLCRLALKEADSSLLYHSTSEQCGISPTDNEKTNIPSSGSDSERIMLAKEKKAAQEMEGKLANTEIGLSPMEMIKTGRFYMLSFVLMMLLLGLNVENNVYKQFGLLTITDDHFLTLVGTLTNVTVCLSRIIWGVLVDTIGPKQSIVASTSLHTICCAFWFFTPLVSKWFYLFWTLVTQATQSALFVAYPVIILRYYGNAHYVSNYGLVISCGFLINIITPPVVDTILANLGYFWLFFTLAATSAVSFGVALFLPPENVRDRGQ